MDEITTTGKTFVAELKEGHINTFEINPEDYGIEIVGIQELQGGDPKENAQYMKHLLRGKGDKAYEDIVALNSAAALVVSGAAVDLHEGLNIARDSISKGRPNEVLCNLIAISNEVMSGDD